MTRILQGPATEAAAVSLRFRSSILSKQFQQSLSRLSFQEPLITTERMRKRGTLAFPAIFVRGMFDKTVPPSLIFGARGNEKMYLGPTKRRRGGQSWADLFPRNCSSIFLGNECGQTPKRIILKEPLLILIHDSLLCVIDPTLCERSGNYLAWMAHLQRRSL